MLDVSLALLILPLWFIKMTRGMFFYLYLWQLKEYHSGRFIDHFRTEKGKSLIFNKLVLVKLALLIFTLPVFVLLLYALEAAKGFYDIWKKRLRKPVYTKKTILLIAMHFGILLLVAGTLFFMVNRGMVSPHTSLRTLLAFDILTPILVSAVVLGLQPFTVLARNRLVKKASAHRRKFKDLKVIGITGSYGKTSTKEFLAHILSQKFHVLKTPEHMNSEVGIANTILGSLTDEHEIFVCEMGAYNKGGIKLLADIAKPHIGMVTGVNEQHLATFGSMENLLSAEGGKELIEALPKDGTAFVNQTVKGYETVDKVSYYREAERVKVEKENVSFEVEGIKFKVPAYGKHNVENLLGAISVARELGMSLEEIAKACETIDPNAGAMKLLKGVNDTNIIDSSYSANPDGVLADLEYLSLWQGKKVIVMPCLIELGKATKEVHERIGKKIGEVCDLAIITTRECFQDVKEGAKGKEVLFLDNSQEILEKVKDAEVILLEGGKESALQRQLLTSLKND